MKMVGLLGILLGGLAVAAAGEAPTECGEGQKAAVVFFVLEDCPVSNALVPEMERTVKEYTAKGVKFTYAYINPKLKAVAKETHIKEYGLTAPAVIDRGHEIVKKAGATVTPEAAVFRKGGELAYCGRINNLYVGFGQKRQVVNEHDLRVALDAVLAGDEVVPKAKAKAVGCYISDYRK